tara:strand:+ start:51 stop:356 length:306 start_codon:yes stop_codon:yes gene_type:complete
MSSHLLAKLKNKVKKISFKSKMDAISRQSFLFTGLNGRDQGKIHGRTTEGHPERGPFAAIEDVFHSMGCDLFGASRYNITIQVQEIEDVKRAKTVTKKESP